MRLCALSPAHDITSDSPLTMAAEPVTLTVFQAVVLVEPTHTVPLSIIGIMDNASIIQFTAHENVVEIRYNLGNIRHGLCKYKIVTLANALAKATM